MAAAATTGIWILVFIALYSGTSGRATLADVPGFYLLQFSGKGYCHFLLELRGTDAVLNATDTFMDGVQFARGHVNLSVTDGHIDWNAAEGRSNWNRSLGPIVNGAISRSTRGQEKFQLGKMEAWDYAGSFVIMKPNMDFKLPVRRRTNIIGEDFERVFNLTKGDTYLFHEASRGDCLYKKGDPNQTQINPTPAPVEKNTTATKEPAEALRAENKGSTWRIIGTIFIATTVIALLIIVVGFAVFRYRSKTRFQQNVNSAPMQ